MVEQNLSKSQDTIMQELRQGGLSDDLVEKYQHALNKDYLLDYSIKDIINDIKIMETLSNDNQYAISLGIESKRDKEHLWQIKLFKLNDQVSLSRGLPIIENFGFKLLDEHPYALRISDKSIIHVCDFGVIVPEDVADKIHDTKLANILCESIVAVFNREIENGGLNKLVLFSGLTAREVSLLRAVGRYLTQTALPLSRQYTAECLVNYPNIASHLYALFDAKFNITNHSKKNVQSIHNKIMTELTKVESLDDDRVIKAFLVIIEAMVRTNYYQVNSNNEPKDYISFKIKSHKVPFLPKPLPLYEVFVYSIRFEAIHLRAGFVARGGLRWSDRREDFRTEVLGLVKAQKVKNSIIVPTGSKGGFVCKKLPPISDRAAYIADGIACYKNFIAGLLDITDNLVSGKIVPPINVVRYDNDDPYLVVAADKGTATFSDFANEMSAKYGFWLGDAFASGGSVGYDHKKMGITARGAWEACKRHFRHLGVNIQTEDFSVIGLGDMSGDVFGNGMMLSKHIRLLAAFNHQHIFLDPNPDAMTSFTERKRMFNLLNSSWANYDKSKISAGGGIYKRSAKFISLSKEVRKWLGIEVTEISPSELIHLILQAHADLFYNGGIGTYIKAETESNEDAQDKANDGIRVNGNELNVKVVVEGGNLTATQLGRVEFAKKGGLIYTDAIDNSAGVDCSDHEVNIKILFADIMQETAMTIEERNKILESMTDDIAQLVLRDNYLQTQILSYAHARSSELFSIYVNFMDKLEKSGELDRKVEFLPNNQEILERQRSGIGLTPPELAVLLAYSKMRLDHEILNSSLVNGEEFNELLIDYFPEHLQKTYGKNIIKHYLRKEIIATQLSNLVTNRMGITFVSRFEDEFRVNASQIVRAFWVVYKLFDVENIYKQIEELDNKVAADIQVEMLIRVKKALERTSRWILRRYKDDNKMLSLINKHKDEITQLLTDLPKFLDDRTYPNISKVEHRLNTAGVPAKFAAIIARSSGIPQLLDIISLTKKARGSIGAQHQLHDVVANYFYIGRTLHMDWLRTQLINLPENNKWQSLARSALLADGYTLYGHIIRLAMGSTQATDKHFAQTWIKQGSREVKLINEIMEEVVTYKELDPVMLSAVVRELSTIVS